MFVAMVILAQSVAVNPPPLPVAGPALPKVLTVTPSCDPTGEDIVVCGKKDADQYRLRPLGPPPNGNPLPPMTAKLGNGTIDGRAVERCIAGVCSPAAMATIKLPF